MKKIFHCSLAIIVFLMIVLMSEYYTKSYLISFGIGSALVAFAYFVLKWRI